MSYRARRRLVWALAAGVLVSAAAVCAVFFWNTAENVETFSGGEADIYVEPVRHTLTKAERAELVAVAQRFIRTAVTRDHPERAYELVGPFLRGGLSKREWATGNIPVVPYPVESARWKVEYSNSEGVGLLVMVYPAKGETIQPAVFSMGMTPTLTGTKRSWLVSTWVPKGGSPTNVPDSSRSPGQALAIGAETAGSGSARASAAWLAVPLLVICLVLLVPLAFLVREQRLSRRMRRRLDSRVS